MFVFAECAFRGGHHPHEADGLNVLDVLAKTPGLYLVRELRYPCHCCRPCCCRLPCRCPPPHHREADALGILDVLVKTPGLYLVEGPEKYDGHIFSWRNVFPGILVLKLTHVQSQSLNMKTRPTTRVLKIADLAKSEAVF